MKFEKKAVIFDLDGVICFTDKFHYQAWKALADRIGIYFDEKINDRLRGVSRMASLDIILERSTVAYTLEEKEAFAEEKNNTYRELLKTMSPADLTDEVWDTLNEGAISCPSAPPVRIPSSFWGRSVWATSLTPSPTAPISPAPSPIPRCS